MKVFDFGLATITALVTMSGSALAHGHDPISGAPAPALAAGIPALIIIGGTLLSSKLFKRFRA